MVVMPDMHQCGFPIKAVVPHCPDGVISPGRVATISTAWRVILHEAGYRQKIAGLAALW
jgi:RNA-splicing ligase RtcB